jgi:hypothetical protein
MSAPSEPVRVEPAAAARLRGHVEALAGTIGERNVWHGREHVVAALAG